jgi:hypothetical protein
VESKNARKKVRDMRKDRKGGSYCIYGQVGEPKQAERLETQIKSNQIKSNQINSIQVKSIHFISVAIFARQSHQDGPRLRA